MIDPYIKGFNSMPRVILAPIFAVWFGLGIWSKVALGVTLVFFIVFFNVYQGVREVSPACSPTPACWARAPAAAPRLPASALGWVFSSLHTSVGLAFVGAVVGEYLGGGGVGYLILQAEGVDINTVFAGILVLTAFALVLDALVGLIERRLMRWQPSGRQPSLKGDNHAHPPHPARCHRRRRARASVLRGAREEPHRVRGWLQTALYYLPLTIADTDRLGYFKAEGLDVRISDLAGGAKSIQALLGGSADVVTGAYDHTIQMQAKHQPVVAVTDLGRFPGIVLGVTKAKAATTRARRA